MFCSLGSYQIQIFEFLCLTLKNLHTKYTDLLSLNRMFVQNINQVLIASQVKQLSGDHHLWNENTNGIVSRLIVNYTVCQTLPYKEHCKEDRNSQKYFHSESVDQHT